MLIILAKIVVFLSPYCSSEPERSEDSVERSNQTAQCSCLSRCFFPWLRREATPGSTAKRRNTNFLLRSPQQRSKKTHSFLSLSFLLLVTFLLFSLSLLTLCPFSIIVSSYPQDTPLSINHLDDKLESQDHDRPAHASDPRISLH